MKDYMKRHYEHEARYEIAQQIDAAINNNEVDIRLLKEKLVIDESERVPWESVESIKHQIEILEIKNRALTNLFSELAL